jgi:hypothetical protein
VYLIGELLLEGMKQRCAPLRVQGAHALDVAREVPVNDEIRDDGLLQRRAAAIEKLVGPANQIDLPLWYYQVTKPESREQDLAEGTGVEYAAAFIQAFQRRQRA